MKEKENLKIGYKSIVKNSFFEEFFYIDYTICTTLFTVRLSLESEWSIPNGRAYKNFKVYTFWKGNRYSLFH